MVNPDQVPDPAPLNAPPTHPSVEAPETIIESAPPLLLGKLRQLDAAINALKDQQTALLHGYAYGRGWSLQTHNVGLDTNTGQIVVSPI